MGINKKFNLIKTKMGIVIFSIGKPKTCRRAKIGNELGF